MNLYMYLYWSIKERLPGFDPGRVKMEIQGRLASVASIVCQINGCLEKSMRQYMRRTRETRPELVRDLNLARMAGVPRNFQWCGDPASIAGCLARWPTRRVRDIVRTFPEPFGTILATRRYIMLPVTLATPGTRCTICLEMIDILDEVYRIPCGHQFHVKCLDEHLLIPNRRCPNCRGAFVNRAWALS